MADANEKCDISRARRLLQVAGDQGVLFVEEPLPASEVAGYRALAQHGVGIATGEHFQSRESFVSLMTEGTVAVIQPDLAMVGGLTPVLELCTVANALNVAVSPHFFPGLFVHVAAAAPNLKWLEDFPLLEPLFDGGPAIGIDGRMKPGTSPGHGLTLQDEFRAAL